MQEGTYPLDRTVCPGQLHHGLGEVLPDLLEYLREVLHALAKVHPAHQEEGGLKGLPVLPRFWNLYGIWEHDPAFRQAYALMQGLLQDGDTGGGEEICLLHAEAFGGQALMLVQAGQPDQEPLPRIGSLGRAEFTQNVIIMEFDADWWPLLNPQKPCAVAQMIGSFNEVHLMFLGQGEDSLDGCGFSQVFLGTEPIEHTVFQAFLGRGIGCRAGGHDAEMPLLSQGCAEYCIITPNA
jgi:hypothetical protein